MSRRSLWSLIRSRGVELFSLTYQLEILHAQANLMRNMGFADVLSVELARDRRSMKIAYWVYVLPRVLGL